jgi:DNA-binding transcriptional MocR family regulator
MVEDLPPGNQDLRRAIARRYNACGVELDIDDIVITSGGLDALNLCLQAVTRPGDTVAIESPAFYAALQAIERLGLRAVELRTHPRDGVDPDALAEAIARHPIRACWLMPSFQNPLGATMPAERKRALVALLARHDIPLIEDDVYGELHFGDDKPKPAKAWDRAGLVLHCGSFSKCLAPGYRVGWTAPGRYVRDVARMKIMTTLSAGIPTQAAIAEYLAHGGYDHHLRTLRRDLEARCGLMSAAIARHFPDNNRVTRPGGGYFLWLDMPGVDALALHRAALAEGISIAPGPIFSPTRQFAHCMRLNFGQPWTARTEAAIATLGRMVGAMAARGAAMQARAG